MIFFKKIRMLAPGLFAPLDNCEARCTSFPGVNPLMSRIVGLYHVRTISLVPHLITHDNCKLIMNLLNIYLNIDPMRL